VPSPPADASNAELLKIGGAYFAAAVAIIWNWLNWRRTLKLEKKAFTTKQWDDVKSNINSALDAFVREANLTARLPMLQLDADENKKKLNELSQSISLAQDELARRLREADNSTYISGESWESLADGLPGAEGSSWDLIVNFIADAQADISKLNELARVKAQAEMIREMVNSAARKETLNHDPKRKLLT
jgi:hypothetical protein